MDMKTDMRYEARYGLGTDPLSTEDCTSPAYFAREKERLFKRAWLCVGREDDVPEVGSYLVKDIAVLNTSIIVVRDKTNKINAFHNICTHRLNKIMQPGTGKAKAFTCQFHGWAFGLDGKLIHSIAIRDVKSRRVGNFWLDTFNFVRVTDSTGWDYNALILFIDDRVVYTLDGGQPRISKRDRTRNPLGPLQTWGDILAKRTLD